MVIAFLRTIILYVFIIAGIRLMGKRQVGELEPSELVLALLIADLAAVPMQDFGIPLLTGLIPILTLLCLTMALSVLTMKSVKFRAVLCGRPSIIVENGKLRQGEMRKNRFTLDELMEELRMKGSPTCPPLNTPFWRPTASCPSFPLPPSSPPPLRTWTSNCRSPACRWCSSTTAGSSAAV